MFVDSDHRSRSQTPFKIRIKIELSSLFHCDLVWAWLEKNVSSSVFLYTVFHFKYCLPAKIILFRPDPPAFRKPYLSECQNLWLINRTRYQVRGLHTLPDNHQQSSHIYCKILTANITSGYSTVAYWVGIFEHFMGLKTWVELTLPPG